MQRPGDENVHVWAVIQVLLKTQMARRVEGGEEWGWTVEQRPECEATQVEVSKPDLAPGFEMDFGVKRSICKDVARISCLEWEVSQGRFP